MCPIERGRTSLSFLRLEDVVQHWSLFIFFAYVTIDYADVLRKRGDSLRKRR